MDSNDIRVSTLKDKIHVRMRGKLANVILNTEFAYFRSLIHAHITLNRIIKPYFLPKEVALATELVDGILRFPTGRSANLMTNPIVKYGTHMRDEIYRFFKPEEKGHDDLFACNGKCKGFTTPAVLQKAYNFKPVKNVAAGNSMAVAEFQLQYYDRLDLVMFSKFCDANVTVDRNIGGNVEPICMVTGCVEALLDIEYIKAVAGPIPLTVMYSFKYSLMDWLDKILAMNNPPLVHSLSYGNDEVQQTSVSYMLAVNQQLMKAAARGLSIVIAAGDQGVWGRSGNEHDQKFHPDFPASSPYVTSVGGTDFKKRSHIGKETTWTCGGGGFSNTFARPTWQENIVSNYLNHANSSGLLPNSSLFNASGRAYPDVSVLGGRVNPYCVSVRGGSFRGVSGTSASAPVIAGLLAQLNNIRLCKGKPPLGFVNPFLYQNADCFRDIDDGSMNNCLPKATGFVALSGWDPATGFGSPNVECLKERVKKLS